jgi:hypothetical protein
VVPQVMRPAHWLAGCRHSLPQQECADGQGSLRQGREHPSLQQRPQLLLHSQTQRLHWPRQRLQQPAHESTRSYQRLQLPQQPQQA